jgi:hypothetical protein
MMQFGQDYRNLHLEVWEQCRLVCRPDAIAVVNVSNHIRKGEEIDVVGWHRQALELTGWTVVDQVSISTPRLRHGQNHEKRVLSEELLICRRAR